MSSAPTNTRQHHRAARPRVSSRPPYGSGHDGQSSVSRGTTSDDRRAGHCRSDRHRRRRPRAVTSPPPTEPPRSPLRRARPRTFAGGRHHGLRTPHGDAGRDLIVGTVLRHRRRRGRTPSTAQTITHRHRYHVQRRRWRSATVTVTVVDQNGAPVAGARVLRVDSGLPARDVKYTNAKGKATYRPDVAGSAATSTLTPRRRRLPGQPRRQAVGRRQTSRRTPDATTSRYLERRRRVRLRRVRPGRHLGAGQGPERATLPDRPVVQLLLDRHPVRAPTWPWPDRFPDRGTDAQPTNGDAKINVHGRT